MPIDYCEQMAERENGREDDRKGWTQREHIRHLESCIKDLEGINTSWGKALRKHYQDDLARTQAALLQHASDGEATE